MANLNYWNFAGCKLRKEVREEMQASDDAVNAKFSDWQIQYAKRQAEFWERHRIKVEERRKHREALSRLRKGRAGRSNRVS